MNRQKNLAIFYCLVNRVGRLVKKVQNAMVKTTVKRLRVRLYYGAESGTLFFNGCKTKYNIYGLINLQLYLLLLLQDSDDENMKVR